MKKIDAVKVGETFNGDVILRFITIKGIIGGPTVAFVSGIHGNETSSIGGLLSFLEEFHQLIPEENMAGTLITLPFANPLGIARCKRNVGVSCDNSEDLNRRFDGTHRKLSLSDRSATAIEKYLQKRNPNFVVDLHCMSSRSIPMVILDHLLSAENHYLETRVHMLASSTGLPIVHDFTEEQYVKNKLDMALSARMLKNEIPSFTIEVPGGAFAQPSAMNLLRGTLWNMVRAVKMVVGINELVEQYCLKPQYDNSVPDATKPDKQFQRANGPIAERDGFFYPFAAAGEFAEKDKELGIIVGRTGNIVQKIKMPDYGCISSITDASIVATGDELFELLVPKK